mgnify:CR=1 FL=1
MNLIEIVIKSYETGITPSTKYCNDTFCNSCKFSDPCDFLNQHYTDKFRKVPFFSEAKDYLNQLKSELPPYEELKQQYPEYRL